MGRIKDSMIYQQFLRFRFWYAVFNAVVWIGFAIFRHVFWQPLLGLVLGSVFSFFNYLVLGLVLEGALKRRSPRIGLTAVLSYAGRLVALAVILYIAYSVSMDTFVSAVFPLLFPQLILWLNRKKG